MLGSAQQTTNPRLQFAERKRLDQVIVGAQFQPQDAICHAVAGREHQHRHIAHRPQGFQHPIAIQTRQHQIEDHQICRFVAEAGDGLFAIARHNHVVAVQPQACLDQIADRRLIIDHQNPLTTLPNRYCALGHQDLWKELQASTILLARGV